MKFPDPQVDYRDFRLSRLREPQYRHMWLLLFWPVYLMRYFAIERLNPAASYTVIHCALDDQIPFCEGFLVFYVLWYVCIFGMHLFTMLYDVDAFRRYSAFLIVGFTISTTIFLVFPSCQELRPAQLPRDNCLCRIVALLYRADTNTNVCPSEHVIGALGVLASAIHTPRLRSPGKIAGFTVAAILISLSTVFLKQHSVLDVLAALPVCAVAYWICYGRRKKA